MNDKVAIITPSFNRGYIIGETAESVFAQSHENWEWIIVDDGSTDYSWDLIQSYARRDSRVKAIQRDRIPLVKKHIQRKWHAICPDSPRQLGAHPWTRP